MLSCLTRLSWKNPTPKNCHSDRRDGAFCRPEAEVRFSIERFLCDESLFNFEFEGKSPSALV